MESDLVSVPKGVIRRPRMQRVASVLAMTAIALLVIAPVYAAPDAGSTFRVGNTSTALTIEATPPAPRVLAVVDARGSTWVSKGAVPLLDHATVGGKPVAVHWRFDNTATKQTPDGLTLVYVSSNPSLRLSWEWKARAAQGPVEHTIRVENLGKQDVVLSLQDSLHLSLDVPPEQALEHDFIDKGAGKAPPVGTHVVPMGDGYRWTGESSPFAHPAANEPREIIPWSMIRVAGDTPSDGIYLGVEFSGRVAVRVSRKGNAVELAAGLNPEPGPFQTTLHPGGVFITPTVFLGATHGTLDDAGNLQRGWVRAVLNDPVAVNDPRYPLLTNNSWGSGMKIDAGQARRMIDDSAELGFEMFHLDAGWFQGVGDWIPDPKKFPDGLAPVADYAHAKGLKFGLWVDWAQAGTSKRRGAMSVANSATRDWLTTDPPAGWKPAEFKGVTIDIGVPAAKAWVAGEADRLVRDYHLDMLEHDGSVIAQGCDRSDHPHAICDAKNTRRYVDEEFFWLDGPNSTDVSYHAAMAYYDIYRKLKKDHPGLLLEICNDGGRMVDFGSAAVGDYFSIVDTYDPVSNRQAFFDASHLLPSAMLEAYVMEWPAPRIENFRYMLRSGMMGWFTLMMDSTKWDGARHDAAAAELALYKARLRPLIRRADLYHVGPRPDGMHWDGTQYIDKATGQGVLFAFHGSDTGERSHVFVLKGLEPTRNYRLHFNDGSSPDTTLSGQVLMHDGFAVDLPLPDSSELVFIQAQPSKALVTQPDVVVAAARDFTDPNPALVAMMRSALLNTGTQIAATADGTAYVRTGDIPAEWLRDSSVQVEATYLGFAHDAQVQALIKAVVQRQAKYLLIDPYANAFREDYSIWERKFELDSLCYPVLLAWKYYKVTGDVSIFTPEVRQAFTRVLDTMEIEQDHTARSQYEFKSSHERSGRNPVARTGMIWTGFRPSDDVSTYNYLIPAEMMAVQALGAMSEAAEVMRDAGMVSRARKLRNEVDEGIRKYGIVKGPEGKSIYAYEVDGLGHALLMDDANIPNLLSAPYFGYVDLDDPVYQATRSFVLSPANPYYYSGSVAAGLGSPHTPKGMVWPLGLLADGFTTKDPTRQQTVLRMLLASDPGDHRLHESFDPSNPKILTREDFGWPNAFFTEFMAKLHGAADHPKPVWHAGH
jgi:alpha-galactosidase